MLSKFGITSVCCEPLKIFVLASASRKDEVTRRGSQPSPFGAEINRQPQVAAAKMELWHASDCPAREASCRLGLGGSLGGWVVGRSCGPRVFKEFEAERRVYAKGVATPLPL